jgi:Family of unknown function (DUF5819)
VNETAAPGAADGIRPAARRPGRGWSRALVAIAALVIAGLVGTQLITVFLYNAPANAVSKRYSAQISWWMDPLQNQDWQLFAPNPISENVEVYARASIGASAGISPWLDLSAIDRAATVGNPAPSHMTMNGLRNAWREYEVTHSASGQPSTSMAGTAQQYLQNLVLDYLRPRESGTIDSIQVRFVVTLIPGSGRTAAQTAPQTQTLNWWVVVG